MGVVYEARDPNLDRRVAIKTVKIAGLSDESAAEYEMRFRTEARSAGRLQHPNIVSVYDADRDDTTPFLVMEFVAGQDLKQHLDSGVRYPLEQTVHMMSDLLSALEYAHARKIVHRDIKPANLLIEASGRLKLTDFGVARIQDSGDATRTQGGMVGTLKYMSPEQAQGLTVDAASDIFSAGVVLYQLLTDRRPFDGESYFQILTNITQTEPQAPSSINQKLPHALDAVVARALAKNKAARYTSAAEFASALQAAARCASDPTVTPSANPFKPIVMPSVGERTGSTVGSTSNATGSTVTQELELVYWKDIKDSSEVEELEIFLAKFPEGVYVDLAKRRLKKLHDQIVAQGASSRYESTMVAAPATLAIHADPTWPTTTAGINQQTKTKDRTIAAPAHSVLHNDTWPSQFSVQPVADVQTEKEPVVELLAPASTTPPKPSQAAQPEARLPAPVTATTQTKSSKKPWLVAVGVAVVMGLGAIFFGQSQPNATDLAGPLPVATAATSAVAASSSTPSSVATEATVTVANKAATNQPAATASIAASASATAVVHTTTKAGTASQAIDAKTAALHRNAASSSKTASNLNKTSQVGTQSQNLAVNERAHPVQVVVAQRNATSEATVAAKPVGKTSPRDACENRVLLGFQFCMKEQCSKSEFHAHPVCLERLEMEDRRRGIENAR